MFKIIKNPFVSYSFAWLLGMAVIACPGERIEASSVLNPPWANDAVIYQIYIPSFNDSDGDGMGDLRGVSQKIQYLKDLGINTIYLSPVFKSTNFDWGYDVTDLYSIQPALGTLDDLHKIIRKAHAMGMHLLLDFPINHVSKDHPWFIESASSRTNPKADWFVWKDPSGYDVNSNPLPPDATPASLFFGGSAWEYSATRGQFYYHFFHKEMPDLNYDNPDVKNAIFDAIRYWYALGVDGLRVDIPTTIFQSIPFSNPVVEGLGGDMARNHVIFSELRAIDPSKLLIAENFLEVLGVLTGMPSFFIDFSISMSPWEFQLNQDFAYIYYSDPIGLASNPAYFNYLRSLRQSFSYGTGIPINVWAESSNHDYPRPVTIQNAVYQDPQNKDSFTRALTALMLFDEAVPAIYYGNEIGMTSPNYGDSSQYPHYILRDPILVPRDNARSPMQWNESPNAGFSTNANATPWLPVNVDYPTRNVQAQKNDQDSFLSMTKRALELRKLHSPTLTTGALNIVTYVDPLTFTPALPALYDLVIFKRDSATEHLVIIANLGFLVGATMHVRPVTLSLNDLFGVTEATKFFSSSFPSHPSETAIGTITVQPMETILISLPNPIE